MNNKVINTVLATALLATSSVALADVSATVKLASDYTFNGVSQTSNDPALQASLDYANDSGFYTGSWISNLDFGNADDTNIEWDFYVGQFMQLNENISLDVGLAYYTYHGDSVSDSYYYPEAYSKFGYSSSLGNSELNFWYTNDYFGFGADHYIMMAAHTFTVAEGHDVRLSFDRSTSKNVKEWSWDGKGYNHYRVEYMTSQFGFDFNIAAENTTLDWDTADERIVLSVSRTFSF